MTPAPPSPNTHFQRQHQYPPPLPQWQATPEDAADERAYTYAEDQEDIARLRAENYALAQYIVATRSCAAVRFLD
jgi:hypothetical protein